MLFLRHKIQPKVLVAHDERAGAPAHQFGCAVLSPAPPDNHGRELLGSGPTFAPTGAPTYWVGPAPTFRESVCRDLNATDANGHQSVPWLSDRYSIVRDKMLACPDLAVDEEMAPNIIKTVGDVLGIYLTGKTLTGGYLAGGAGAFLTIYAGIIDKLDNMCITWSGDGVYNRMQQGSLNPWVAALSAAEACCAVIVAAPLCALM